MAAFTDLRKAVWLQGLCMAPMTTSDGSAAQQRSALSRGKLLGCVWTPRRMLALSFSSSSVSCQT